MVKVYKQPFAHDGDAIAIPDASQPDGKMSNVDGWTPDYQLPKTDPNYKPVGRQEMNGVFKEVTEALGQIQQFGFAKWQPITWPQGARVVEGGVVYRALNQTSQQPPHADWADESPIGVGQTWQDMTGSRAVDTTYTNTAGRPIYVTIGASALASGSASRIALIVDGVTASRNGGAESLAGTNSFASASAIVPAGSVYSAISLLGGFTDWSELR